MKRVIKFINTADTRTGDWALLALRLVLAFGFYEPSVKKFGNINGASEWLGNLGFPLPKLAVLLAGTFEFAGFFLLMLGLLTRYITIPLMLIMIIVILTVHWGNGFAAANNGFEIPFYYLVMLFVIFSKGPGKYSIDEAVVAKIQK
ncbi:HvfX family Cu-binding RiPP maturation protein [Carboxylicivirga marina]|uniref:DoxX family protein n=1 Tax=Carboxylicivirga marina TaxID=2800988 RepID=A0ABS1HNR4_9BACT|nr:DoxX family protein [Carboxylicivirga marina]MBK3519317.1 DoxX family protein [Carboxylicivirga marina]